MKIFSALSQDMSAICSIGGTVRYAGPEYRSIVTDSPEIFAGAACSFEVLTRIAPISSFCAPCMIKYGYAHDSSGGTYMEPPVSKVNSHRKKMIAPIVITAVVLIYYIVFFSFLLSALPDTVSRLLLGIIPVLSGAVLIGVCAQRIREIKGGEEDDLGQY